jgi:hypothetical protein
MHIIFNSAFFAEVIQASVDMEAAEMAAGQAAIELAHLKSGLNLLDLNGM